MKNQVPAELSGWLLHYPFIEDELLVLLVKQYSCSRDLVSPIWPALIGSGNGQPGSMKEERW